MKPNGRKYDIAKLAMWQGFAVTLGGIGGAMVKPEAAPHIAAIIGSFAIVQSVGVGAFNAANAYVSGRHGPTTTTIETATVTQTQSKGEDAP